MILGITMNPDAELPVLQRAAELAESLGFTYCYVADQGFSRDAYVTLASLASCTTTLRLGPGITHPYVRHPAATAVAVATLDEVSKHRAFLGVGAGGSRTLGPLNLQRTQPLTASREMVEIARLLWTGLPVTYTGTHFQLRNARLGFKCRPDIEVHWAARGPKMLELGGQLADVIFLHGIPFSAIAPAVVRVRQAAETAGRRVRIHLAVSLAYDDHSLASARLRTAYRLVDLSEETRDKLGLPSELADEIARRVLKADLWAASELVNDVLLANFVIDVRQSGAIQDLASQIDSLQLDGLIVELPDPSSAHLALLAAKEAIDRLQVLLSTKHTENPEGQEVSYGTA